MSVSYTHLDVYKRQLVTLCKIIMPIFRNPSFTWKLRDELEFLDNYVKMMRIRYGSGMEFNLERCV